MDIRTLFNRAYGEVCDEESSFLGLPEKIKALNTQISEQNKRFDKLLIQCSKYRIIKNTCTPHVISLSHIADDKGTSLFSWCVKCNRIVGIGDILMGQNRAIKQRANRGKKKWYRSNY